MSYEKDKELMQKIHDLIDDYNYLDKVTLIIRDKYVKERVNFYIETYQDYKDILDYQIYLINDFFNVNVDNPINMEEIKKSINETVNIEFINYQYYDFNQSLKNTLIELDKKIKKDIETLNKKDFIIIKFVNFYNQWKTKIFTNEISEIDLLKFKLLHLDFLDNYTEIKNIKNLNLSKIEDKKLISILDKIKKLDSLDFFSEFKYIEDFGKFFNHKFFNVIKNNLFENNIIEDYKFKNDNLIKLIDFKFEKKYDTYSIDNFFITDWVNKNVSLSRFREYIKNEFEECFKKLDIYQKRFESEDLILSNDYSFLFFFGDFNDFNFDFLLYILKNLQFETLVAFFTKLPQNYKNLFDEKLIGKFDKENEINPFRKLQLNNKLNQNIITRNKKEKINKI